MAPDRTASLIVTVIYVGEFGCAVTEIATVPISRSFSILCDLCGMIIWANFFLNNFSVMLTK